MFQFQAQGEIHTIQIHSATEFIDQAELEPLKVDFIVVFANIGKGIVVLLCYQCSPKRVFVVIHGNAGQNLLAGKLGIVGSV